VALRTVGVRLMAEVADYQRKMRAAGQTTRDFSDEMGKAAETGKLDHVADRAGVMGLALVGAFGYAVKSAADFDKAMSGVSAATHANAKDMSALREAALQAGKDTQYSATQAAGGITELSKAGVKTADILGGGLKGALALASAGQLDVGEASEIAATAMTQFRLSGEKVPHIADLLAAGAGKAQGSVHDMGAALNQSGLVASQFGLSIEDTTGVLAEFANAGLIGSDAGTSLKTMLLALANPSQQTKLLMEQLGISFYDASGKFIGLSGVAQVLQTKLSGLTDAQRQQALGQIFGNDAIRSASILYTDGAAGVAKWKGAVDDAGYASETASKLTDNLAGDLERLKGSVETLAIESGSGANSGLRVLAQSLDALVSQFLAMPPAVSGTLTVLAGVGGAVLLGFTAWVKLRKGIAEVVTQLEATGPAGEKAAAGLQKSAGMAGKAALAFAGLEIAAALFNSLDDKSANVDRLSASLENLAKTGQSAGELNNIFGKNFDGLGRIAGFAESANHGFGKFIDTTLGSIPIIGDAGKAIGNFGSRLIAGTDFDTAKEQMSTLDSALVNFMNTTNDAKKSSQLWNQVLSQSGLDTQQLAELLPNAYKKVGELNAAADKGKGALGGMASASGAAAGKTGELSSALNSGKQAQKEYKTEAEAAAGAARGERAALVALSSAMKAQVDPVFAFIDAEKTMTEAQKNATKAVKEHGRTSVEAKEATRKLAEAAIDLQAKAGALGDKFDGKLTPAMRNTLRAAGLTKAQVHDVETQFESARKAAEKYDDKYEAKASAPGAKQSETALASAWAQAKGFDGHYNAHATVTGVPGVKSQLASLLIQQDALKKGIPISAAAAAYRKNAFADGGWTGPGSKYDEAGVVHADEFVINKDSRRKIESRAPGMLDAMNATGMVPGYASGGLVTWPFRTTAAMTRIPSKAEALAAVTPAVPSGGATDAWIIRTVKAHFPGLNYISAFRPGAMTLTGNRSYHSMHRAVDWPASHALAKWWHDTFMSRTKELITPWNDLNIHNGRPHRYTGAVWNQHNFAGGNAHDHIAMKSGGTITEPIVGVGPSGRTYSFGENYLPERVVPNWQPGTSSGGSGSVTNVSVVVQAPVGSSPKEIGRQVADVLDSYCRGGGRVTLRGSVTV
jgi:TP901 family phage tail tape measure protein